MLVQTVLKGLSFMHISIVSDDVQPDISVCNGSETVGCDNNIDSNAIRPVSALRGKLPPMDIATAEIRQVITELSNTNYTFLDGKDWVALGDVSRLYRRAYDIYAQLAVYGTHNELWKRFESAFLEMEGRMFPWVVKGPTYQSALHSIANSHKKGIVMTTGSNYALVAKHSITMIRYLGSSLPVQIMYCGNDDLKRADRSILADIPGVELVDLSQSLNLPKCRKGWENKPLAVLASRFQHVILMDADSLFIQAPDVIFEFAGYRETGALLYRDRTLGNGFFGYGERFAALMKKVAKPFIGNLLYKDSRLMQAKSSDEMESGVVVYDKLKTMPALLMTCLLNQPPFMEVLYKASHGDKESYWMSYETMRIPFSIGFGNGGAIGRLEKHEGKTMVCGPMFHQDEDGKPLWFNGGIGSRTPAVELYMYKPEYWAAESSSVNITWKIGGLPYCLHGIMNAPPSYTGGHISKLTPDEASISKKMVSLWIEYFQL
ncbi:hypothetical protein BASA83_004112 [Batrachochytrium salamandrivorans]|nr:hypothetical protein BASA83_004112 [Batrachochytrium salamandrivorans]